MAQPLRNRARVGGSGFTIFTFANQPIAFAQQVSHTSPTPVGPGPVAIHPIDEPYPVQVITPAASGMGSLTLNLYELYNERVWERLGAKLGAIKNTSSEGGGAFPRRSPDLSFSDAVLSGAIDLVDVFIRIAEAPPGSVDVVKHIRPPKLWGNASAKPYREHYHGCVVTDILDGEAVEVGTMEVIKQVTVGYTHTTRSDRSPGKSRAFNYRNAAIS